MQSKIWRLSDGRATAAAGRGWMYIAVPLHEQYVHLRDTGC